MSESGLTQKIRDLLHREAHLKLGRALTTPQWTQGETELRALHATRPPFMIFSRAKRTEHQARVVKVEQAVERLRQRMKLFDACDAYVAKLIEDEIESALRADCPEYIEALGAWQQKDAWMQCLERFDAKMVEFSQILGNARNLACSGYSRHSQVYSSGALEAFELTLTASQQMEEEVKLADQIADAQLEVLSANGIETTLLPRLPELGFSELVESLKSSPLPEAQGHFATLLESSQKLHQTGIPELRTQAEQVHLLQKKDIRGFLSAAWEQFRVEIAPEIFPGDTERSVVKTEEMRQAAVRASAPARK